MKKKINLNNFVILILVVFFIKFTSFFKDVYEISTKDHNLRQQLAYDYCDYSGEGYIFYIKKKYKLKNSPNIVNFKRTPSQNWIFGNYRQSKKSNKSIVLFNLDKNNNQRFDLKNFKVIDNYKNDCLFVEKL